MKSPSAARRSSADTSARPAARVSRRARIITLSMSAPLSRACFALAADNASAASVILFFRAMTWNISRNSVSSCG